MKAFYLDSPLHLRTEETTVPSPGSSGVLVRVENIGICGSDFHLYNGTYSGPCTYPMLFGHEWSGTVERTGPNVTTFQKGDRVTGDCSCFCGECDNCRIDKNLCESIEKFGITIDGASAEYIVRDDKYLYKAPAGMSLELLSLTEPLAVAYQLIKKILEQTGDLREKSILILGGGPIGAGALMILTRQFNCRNVSLFDISEGRATFAEKLGAKIPDPKTVSAGHGGAGYRDMYSNARFDVIIESTGSSEVIANTIYLSRPLGIIGYLGMAPEVTLNQKLIVLKGLTLLGSIGGTGAFADVIAFIHENADQVKPLISHMIPIQDLEQAFQLSRDPDHSMKVLLKL